MASNEHDEAQTNYIQAKHLYEIVPYFEGLADCSFSLADLYFKQAKKTEAETLYRESKELYFRTSSEHGKANCRCSLADILLMELCGRDNLPPDFLEESFRVEREFIETKRQYINLKDDVGQANCLAGMSDVARLQGREREAEELFEQARKVASKAFDKPVEVDPAVEFNTSYLRRWRR